MSFYTQVYDEWQKTRKINQLWQRSDFITQHLREAVGQAQIGASGDFSQVTAAISQSQISTPQLTKIVANPPTTSSARVFNSTDQVIPTNVGTILNFDSTTYDNGIYHNNVINNSRITVTSGGIYALTASMTFLAAGGAHRGIHFIINGNTLKIPVALDIPPTPTANQSLNISTQVALVPDDYVEVEVFQDSGGPITSIHLAGYLPCFTVEKIQ